MEQIEHKSLKKTFSITVTLTILAVLLLSVATIYVCYLGQRMILPDTNQVWLNFTTTYPDGTQTSGRQMIELDQPTELYQIMLEGDSIPEGAGTTEYVIQKLESSFSLLSPHRQVIYRSLSIAMIVLPLLYGVVGITLGTWWFYRKYLAEPLKLLADATEQIHNQNLDFSISYGRNDEFGQLCESFEKMRQTLYDNNRRMWNMLEERRLLQASVAHDLRNPIAIIGGYIEYLQKNILQDRISQDKVLHILDNMATASKRLEQYTNSIRDISSLENMETNLVSCQIPELMETMADDFAVMVQQKGLCFQFEMDASNRMIQLDPQILYRILENLVTNALRFAKENIIMNVFFEKSEELSISITDDGAGFSEEILKAQLPLVYTTDTSGEHLGMGLIISRILCQKLNGKLELSNHVDGGASVKIKLNVS